MTSNQLRELVKFYGHQVESHECGRPEWCPECKVAEMVPQMVSFVDEGRIEKAHRWLGFVQGILSPWGNCPRFTLNQLKEHSRRASDSLK